MIRIAIEVFVAFVILFIGIGIGNDQGYYRGYSDAEFEMERGENDNHSD